MAKRHYFKLPIWQYDCRMTDSRDQNKFVVRLPPGMRDKIAELARANNRSMNAEIVHRLSRTIADDDSLGAIGTEEANDIAEVSEFDKRLAEAQHRAVLDVLKEFGISITQIDSLSANR